MEEKCIKRLHKMSWLFRLAEWKLTACEKLSPLVNLGIRLWIANIFWKSATLKLPSDFLWVGKGNWDSTLFLFEYEHPIPGFSPEIAAFLGTGFEFLCPILLVLGIATRPAAAILIVMTAFIQITYQQHITHIYWMILLGVLAVQGAGKFSLDSVVRKKLLGSKEYRKLAGLD